MPRTATKTKRSTGVGHEDGFTLVEVLVAAVIMLTGLVSTIGVIDSGNHANNVAQRHDLAIKIAQRELEKVDDLNFSQVALTSTPASSPDPNNPANRVNGTQFTTDGGQIEPLIIGGTDAAIAPGPESVNEGGVESQVYRYVSWVDSQNYQGCTQNCSSTQDYKRVTIAVRATSGTIRGFDNYVLLSTVRIDPFLGPDGHVTQPPDPNPTQAHNNFYLYDTPASSCSTNSYQQPSGDHPAHDTRGYCGSADGDYPDLMGLDVPPNPFDPDLPPLYTYSNDLAGDYTGGLAIQQGADCTLTGLNKYELHQWTTNVLSAAAYELTGKLSFDFWTANVGGVSGGGEICVWLYDRNMVGGAPQDTLIADSSFTLGSWPTSQDNLSFTFSHSAYTLPANHHLRFVLSVNSQSDNDIQFIYDHPDAPSFIQVRTTTPITQ